MSLEEILGLIVVDIESFWVIFLMIASYLNNCIVRGLLSMRVLDAGNLLPFRLLLEVTEVVVGWRERINFAKEYSWDFYVLDERCANCFFIRFLLMGLLQTSLDLKNPFANEL